ncbi:MAG: PorP/SprF family type IX secretion system membrane protein [Maribacter sp.]
MFKPAVLVAFFFLFLVGQAQEVSLPADLRQHSLNQYNASLFNPAFSLDRNNPESVSFWTRWQWQNVDADPTTLFLNYSRSLNENSVASLGFFQHNTGIYFNTGGAINYAYQFEFNRLIKLSIGANVFGFVQQLADTRFPVNPIPGIPQSTPTDDFILQVAPGFNLQVENFSLSLASENLFDYNFTDKAGNTATSDKIFMGMASYDFPVMDSDTTAYLRPSIYLRTIPEQDNQIGLNVLFSTEKYWVQSGYNNFYGISVGAGGTFFRRFSLGALVEFGTSASLNSKDPSFEILASYFLGKPEKRRPIVASGILDENQEVVLLGEELTNEEMLLELEKAEKISNEGERKTEEVNDVDEDQKADEEQIKELEDLNPKEVTITEEEIKEEELKEKQLKESEIKQAKKDTKKLIAEKKALEKQKRKDSVIAVKKEKEVLDIARKKEEEQAEKAAVAAREADELEAVEAKRAKELLEKERLIEQEQQEQRKKEKDAELIAEGKRKEQQRKLDSISESRKAAAVAAEFKLKQDKQKDSINEALKAKALVEALKVKEQQRLDSIRKINEAKDLVAKKTAEEAAKVVEENAVESLEPEVVKPQAGEKYEEVANEDGLEPGYYLIANVFGTKKYFDAFMGDLRGKGLQPKSFFRSLNKYNYAYLERYDTISAARQARDSKFNGKFNGKTWIFRVVGK